MRKEADLFGEIKLEEKTLYGVQTYRCLENLSFSPFVLGSFPELVKSLAQVKKACALANKNAGVISSQIAKLISNACDQIIQGNHSDQFVVDMLHGGGGIAFNQNMNEVLANIANIQVHRTAGEYEPVHPKKHVNASQSTADACATAFRIAIVEVSEKLSKVLESSASILDEKALQYVGINTVARTCLQDAMPVEISSYFKAWSDFCKRRAFLFSESASRLTQINLGGTVFGSGYGASKSYRECVVNELVKVTGKDYVLRDNLYDSAQNLDDLGDISCCLEVTAQGLVKIMKDLRLLASGPVNGFYELSLPSVQEGSSFFTGKINPVIPETLIQACFHVIGNQSAARAALEHGELNLNVFEAGAVFQILQSTKILTSALKLLNSRCLRGIEVNQVRCAEMVEKIRLLQHVPDAEPETKKY